MTNPIINHYGKYITPPKIGTQMYCISANANSVKVAGLVYSNMLASNGGTLAPNAHDNEFLRDDYYASLNAGQAALTRKECIQRLSVMAYGDGIPEMPYNGYECYVTGEGVSLGLKVWFKSMTEAQEAQKSITPEERAAFLYVHKEGE